MKGYKDGINTLSEKLFEKFFADNLPTEEFSETAAVTSTWGMRATNAASSRYSGKGVRVAVLDTGFDLTHPDFKGRKITTWSFISGQDVQDENGHGTHCIGISCGPRVTNNSQIPRYGVAYNAEIFAGKVLSNTGSGSDGGILAGINWALNNRCQIVSMSLGSQRPPSAIYEQVARRALAQGTIIIAAAGNESNRPNYFSPVASPANCASILSIGALDRYLQVASFSNRGFDNSGGQIDLAAPGVEIWSSYPMNRGGWKSLSGTSMATPFVAGLAALWIEATGQTGAAVWSLLARNARRLNLPSVDIGAGLAQAVV